MKKGQGLSLNTIIVAAIVLIVLIVLWAIFTGRMGTFTEGVKTADEQAIEKAKGIAQDAQTGADVGSILGDLETCSATTTSGKCKCGTAECTAEGKACPATANTCPA